METGPCQHNYNNGELCDSSKIATFPNILNRVHIDEHEEHFNVDTAVYLLYIVYAETI